MAQNGGITRRHYLAVSGAGALAAGLGVEVFLFSFQLKNNVFCPFCRAFAAIIITAFIVN